MTTWIRNTNLAAHNVMVPCLVCGRMLLLSDAWIDRDGPAFRAYYHKTCRDKAPEHHAAPAKSVSIFSVSRPCGHCGNVRRCLMVVNAVGAIEYLCRSCARSLAYLDELVRADKTKRSV